MEDGRCIMEDGRWVGGLEGCAKGIPWEVEMFEGFEGWKVMSLGNALRLVDHCP